MKTSTLPLQKTFRALKNVERAKINARFFKTGPGQYGEGDLFLGITVPAIRDFVKKYPEVTLDEVRHILASPYHEERLLAVLFLVRMYQQGDAALRERIFKLYLKSIRTGINNWDLIDTSAEHIVGPHVAGDWKNLLLSLAQSDSVWERRVAMLATFAFTKKGDAAPALALAERLVHDPHDLMQKAVGWMLREVGKRCGQSLEEEFLERYAATMPRTMLRYALEHFSAVKRQKYMKMRKS